MNRCQKCGALPETETDAKSWSVRLKCGCGQATRWRSSSSAALWCIEEWNQLTPRPGLLEMLAKWWARWRDEG